MKKLLFLFSIFVLGQCSFAHFDMSTPVEGNSIVTNDMQFEIVNDLYKMISRKKPSCTDYSIKNTQVLHFPYDVKKKNGKYVSGYWEELWSVKSCDSVYQVPIIFYIKKNKTIYHIDKSFLADSLN